MSSPSTPYQCHTARAKSVSSLPAPQHRTLHRLTPSTSCASSSRSTLSRSSSVRSKPTSPSRLPATDSVSYFPPFESMGSICGDDDGADRHAESSSAASRGESGRRGHAKGRSLGSIAGLMSASLSWGLSSIAPCTSPPQSTSSASSQIVVHKRQASRADCDAVEALAKRFTPGKRRVLEPLPLAEELDSSEKGCEVAGGTHKRRMRSEVEVDKLVLGLGSDARGVKADVEEDDEGLVEGLIDDTPSRPRYSTRRQRPTLQVPIPSFPNWRFPLPSPPVTCLSPDIPLEAFHRAIDNPASATSFTSPRDKMSQAIAVIQQASCVRVKRIAQISDPDYDSGGHNELDEIDDDLFPSPTVASFPSQPATPPRGRISTVDIKHATPPDAHVQEPWSSRSPGLELTRTSSQLSCETVKPMSMYADITPKAMKSWTGLSQGVVEKRREAEMELGSSEVLAAVPLQ